MPSERRWKPNIARILLALSMGLAFLVGFALWFPNPISEENFAKIAVGMTKAEVLQLLGRPEYEGREVGNVTGPDLYVRNVTLSDEERAQLGYREYVRHQWTSSQITIAVIIDGEDKVVCRYRGEGQQSYWVELLLSWLPK